MRKFLTFAIPIATIALFICIMLSGSLLKRPLGNKDDITLAIGELIEDVNQGSWEEVGKEVEELDKSWKQIIKRIQFSSERDEINLLSTNIARLRGAAQARDKANALIELEEAYNHWKQLGE